MDTVLLKTKRGVGAFEFRQSTKVIHPESRKEHTIPVTYSFNFDNNFKAAVPKQVWETIKENRIDKFGTRYCDILQTL